MALRVTEFVKLDGKEIGLYIIQEPDLVCFKILIFTAGETLIVVFKKEGETWGIKPVDYPIWVDALMPAITSTIKQRFLVEVD